MVQAQHHAMPLCSCASTNRSDKLAVPLRILVCTILVGFGVGAMPARADKPLGLGIEASITADDNVTRGYGDRNVLADKFLGVNLNQSFHYPVSTHTRFVLLGFAGFNGYFEYTGLSHYGVGVQGEYQYRTSGSFYAPTFALGLRGSAEEYQSEVRDSFRSSAWLSMRKPITDKLHIFNALTYNLRDGKSEVFDTSDVSLRASTDFALTRRDTIYLGLEYRIGDIVSTGTPSVAYTDIAEAIVPDDAFDDTTRYAYKIDGRTWMVNFGYNHAFSEHQSIDMAWRMINAIPTKVSGASYAAGRIHYTVNQYSIAYMVRF